MRLASMGDAILRPWDNLVEFLATELAPYPGRTPKVLRMVVAAVLTMLLVQVFRLPNGFLAAFYALAISREDPRSIARNGRMVALGNLAGLALAVLGMVLFVDFPLFRFLLILCCFFLAFYATRVVTNYSAAFGFGILVVAATSVNIIWSRGTPLRPDVATVLWTSAGMMLGAISAVVAELLFAPASWEEPPAHGAFFVPGAFRDQANVTFALKGCLAAALCYLAWNALALPGAGVSTVTCVIAGPRVPGSSLRRLSTRLLGLLAGGVLCGMGVQIFVLPALDSIAGFTLQFAVVSALAAWAATSGPRLAYLGRQMALTYYLTIFQGFGPQASLLTSRDRLIGVLFGLLAMWLVFDAAPQWGIPFAREPELS